MIWEMVMVAWLMMEVLVLTLVLMVVLMVVLVWMVVRMVVLFQEARPSVEHDADIQYPS